MKQGNSVVAGRFSIAHSLFGFASHSPAKGPLSPLVWRLLNSVEDPRWLISYLLERKTALRDSQTSPPSS